MVRIKIGAPRRQKKNRYFKAAKGFRGGRSTLWRTVRETLLRAWAFSSRDRRTKKRMFRRLWIIRLNAAEKKIGLSYKAAIVDEERQRMAEYQKQAAAVATATEEAARGGVPDAEVAASEVTEDASAAPTPEAGE